MRINTKNIKKLTISEGLKQKDVAEKLGLHPTAYSFALRSGNTTRGIAEMLSVIFKVPLSEIAADESEIIIHEQSMSPITRKLEEDIDRILDRKLKPIVDQMVMLNKLIDLLNNFLSNKA